VKPVVQLRQRARAVRPALHSLTWLGFRWLCLGQSLWLRPRPLLLRFRWVLLSVLRFRWVLLWVLRFPRVLRFLWVLQWLEALRSRTCLACMAVKGIRLVRRRMERPCLVSQFCLALEPDGAR
jgi:hypothetical protein